MSINNRTTNIELPIKLIFTEDGSSALLTQRIKFSRFKMGDMSEEYGLSLDKVVPASLQRMIMADYISKIEVAGVEPLSNRPEIIDLSELIIYSILYRKYTFVSLEQILKTEPVKKWNHANPFQIIDGKTQFKEGTVQSFLSAREAELAAVQRELMEPVYDGINSDTSLLKDEKKNRTLIARNFVNFAHPLVWFVLLKFGGTSDYHPLVREVRRCLVEFLKKSNIAEYTALMLMELASNIENLNILREAKLLYKTERVDIQRVLQDPKLRLPVIEELRKKNNLLTFSWKLGGASLTAIGTRGRFQVFLYDQDANYKEIRESMDATKAADAAKYNLSEYYRQLHKSGNDLELGMFYLSFLSEACESMGIKFESVVSQTQYTGKTITTLSFGI
jgi:hypothetical protein